ncbi:methyltransferase domain-containing protein [Aeromonas hydrophila]|uniref:methyltransferase domain-containing protein n=1 Tax=Aeromonas hydrophila TaxID=644 RepID=UPI00209EAEAA|nr:methyltransferase domain-containing protein [Aeromonas hydrophila]MCP1265637.1 methyltransferase domain-containing protein [Aeromonas hydrophila]MCP1296602.1 methyltransferase domain-containing protein [Aeromonas hydrophila]
MLHERFQAVDKAQLARRFGAAARHYDAHARFQQEVGQALLERMSAAGMHEGVGGCGLDLDAAAHRRCLAGALPEAGLDLGCGTGFFLPALAGRCSELTGLDLAPGMLAQAALRGSGARLLCGDAEQLPFADETFDWVFSSLALQWCERPAQAFAELHRVLKPGGRLLFSTLLAESLWQLREAWRTVDECDHVNRFLSLPQLQHAIAAGGFVAPALESLTWSLGYPELNGLLRDLKGIGASQVNDERHTGLSSRQRLQRLNQAYEAHRQPDGLLAASYQVCLGQLIRR